jgi:glycosyltransferase involved in cell wall biosynthesis
MFISVIIPTCNRNYSLAILLNLLCTEIQNISYSYYEVIVSDDSIDNQAKKLITKYYPWVNWIEGPKRGPAANRNNGAKYSNGDWLIFLDDDCEPSNNLISKYSAGIIMNKSVNLFEGKIITSRKLNTPLESAPINETGGFFWTCNLCINKIFFLNINGFDETYIYPHLEDNDFANRAKLLTETMFLSDAFVVHPPKKIPAGYRLGWYHASDIYYSIKFNIKISLAILLKKIVLHRISNILNFPLSFDSFIAFKYLIQELLIVILNYKKWEKSFIGQNL